MLYKPKGAAVQWCDYCPSRGEPSAPHDGPHVRFIAELMLSRNAACYSVALTLESASAFDPHPVIWLGMRIGPPVAVHLSWEHVDALADMLTTAKQRYA